MDRFANNEQQVSGIFHHDSGDFLVAHINTPHHILLNIVNRQLQKN